MQQQNMPLLSASDVKLLIAQDLMQKMEQDKLLLLVEKRHRKRQKDIDRCYVE